MKNVAEVPLFKLRRGNSPLLVSMPHIGTHLPSGLLPRLTAEATLVADTDWHLEALYDFLHELDATVIMATHSRYVIDLNRAPNDVSFYPGQNTTGLCPVDSFALQPLYKPMQEPDLLEVNNRVVNYWQPYHTALAIELNRIQQQCGVALLWDAHSIHSMVPRFFSGQLPHLNIGSVDNQSCSPLLTAAMQATLLQFPQYSSVINGRFKGGYITRHYGQPARNIHAIQLEIAMRSYMLEGAPYLINAKLSEALRPVLRALLATALIWSKAAALSHPQNKA